MGGEAHSSSVAQLPASHVSVNQRKSEITDFLAVDHDVSLMRKPPALQSDGSSGTGGGSSGCGTRNN